MTEKLAIEGGSPVRDGDLIQLFEVEYGYEELSAILGVFQQGVFNEGHAKAKFTRQFEDEFADRLGIKHAIAFNSETNAQHAALAAIDIGPGDEVIVPSLTFASTAYTVLIQNAVPIFADSELATFNLDPEDVEGKITERTKAIVPVHWFGHPVDMDPILELAGEYDLEVIEDCAHAVGTEYKGRKAGTIGHMGCFSFMETKSFTTAGEGGMLVTDDDDLAEKVNRVKLHGWLPRKSRFAPFEIVTIGNNYRTTEVQSAFGLAQLRKFDQFYQKRKECTEYLDEHLADIEGVIGQARNGDVKESYLYYPVRFDSEKLTKSGREIAAALFEEGVEAFAQLPELTHVQPLFTEKIGYGTVGCPYECPYYDGTPEYGWGTLPNAERIGQELILLPLHVRLSEHDLRDVVSAVVKVCRAYTR